jgi:hypothetical protein
MSAEPTIAGSWITPWPSFRPSLTPEELADLLVALEVAYEGAWHLADVGLVDIGPFEPLPRALRILRRLRDERNGAA